MVRYSAEVFGYISKPMKQRLKRIRKTDHHYSESACISRGLAKVIPEIEKELGIHGPAQNGPTVTQ